jgi:hypothetical protein
VVVATRDIFSPISGYTKFGEFFPKIAKSVKFSLQNKLPKLSHIFVEKKKHSEESGPGLRIYCNLISNVGEKILTSCRMIGDDDLFVEFIIGMACTTTAATCKLCSELFVFSSLSVF